LADTSEKLIMHIRHLAMTIIAASLIPSMACAEAGDMPTKPAVSYTQFDTRSTANWMEPNAPVGSVAYNKWLGHMFNGVLFNTKDPAEQRRIAERIVDVDYIQHNRLVEHGRAGLLKFMPYFFQAMPDAQFRVHDVIATEGRVVTRWTATGTVTGQDGFLGVPPKGQKIEFDGIDIWTVRNGRLYEHWDQFDWPRALIQLGVQSLPAPFYAVASQPYSR
jgi:steroid delta-isomerase-like uncharacterized protein